MKEILTKDQAIDLIGGEKEYVHSFKNPNGMLIGCDVSWKEFLQKIEYAEVIEKAGEQATSMNHPLCLTINGKYEFIGKYGK